MEADTACVPSPDLPVTVSPLFRDKHVEKHNERLGCAGYSNSVTPVGGEERKLNGTYITMAEKYWLMMMGKETRLQL